MKSVSIYLISAVLFIFSCNPDEEVVKEPELLQLQSIRLGSLDLQETSILEDAPVDVPLVGTFGDAIDKAGLQSQVSLSTDSDSLVLQISFLDQDHSFSILAQEDFNHVELYTLTLGKIKSADGLKEFPGATFRFRTEPGQLILESITIDGVDLKTNQRVTDIPRSPTLQAVFSEPLDPETVIANNIVFNGRTGGVSVRLDISNGGKTMGITPVDPLEGLIKHTIRITNKIKGENGFIYEGSSYNFYTKLDSTFKFTQITDDELLTKVQEETFKYFWDFGHPVSGLARERNTSGDVVTSGGSGFGLMSIPVGIERGFITRQEGVDRIETVVDFLGTADRFHGVWSHWLNGSTGKVVPFSQDDDGGDIVETSYLVMGLLTIRQYLDPDEPQESSLIDKINDLWESVEWNWHVQEGKDVLTWHWSPNYGFQKNHSIRGWNEALITYIMAASSPTYPIEASVYHNGWARGGAIKNGKTYYNITLPLGSDYGGPLFFAHYTFVGIDPRNLEDQYANYWEQNVNHTLINRAHSIENPNNWVGYNENCWGLTASDNNQGYNAHSPTNDLGVITPTAALSSIPYTPEYSIDAIKYFYYFLGDRTWGDYGFLDAFNITENWYASSFLAIDQGPIILMIENYRTGLLWDMFMSCPEVQAGLDKLGFTY